MQAIVEGWQRTGRQDRAARIQKKYLESLPTEMERLRTIQAFFCVCKDTDKPRLQAWYINYMMDDDEYISFMMDNDERKQVLKTFLYSAVEADKFSGRHRWSGPGHFSILYHELHPNQAANTNTVMKDLVNQALKRENVSEAEKVRYIHLGAMPMSQRCDAARGYMEMWLTAQRHEEANELSRWIMFDAAAKPELQAAYEEVLQMM